MDFDSCLQNLVKLSEWHQNKLLDRNEAMTRLQLIDTIFYECLGWSKFEDVKVEDQEDGLYADYIFSCPRRMLAVEAKREGDYFEIPVGKFRNSIYSIQSLIKGNPNLKAALAQVTDYCGQRGIPYAAVCNGSQLIAFIGSRVDSISVLDGKALVFESLEDLHENFHILWQCLSRDGISQNELGTLLLDNQGKELPPKISERMPDYPGIQIRNILQTELQSLSELVLEDIARLPELEKEFLEECYCESGALSQSSMISKNILENRYAELYLEPGAGPIPQPARTKKGNSVDFLEGSINRRPILLIGDVGVGKTTFIRRLINVDAPKVFEQSVTIYIDFGSKANLTWNLRDFVLTEIEVQLIDSQNIDVIESEFVRKVYRKELKRFERSLAGELKILDEKEYKVREIQELQRLVDNRESHLKNSLHYLSSTTRKQIIIILDNADQRNNSTQQEIFLISQELAEHWPCTVFVSLRPETFNFSKREGVLSAYSAKAFTIAPPRVDRVLEKRLKYARKFTQGKEALPSLSGNLVSLSNLDDLIEIFLFSLEKNPAIIELIDNISSGNIRRALDYVKHFFGSGHIDTQKILDIFRASGSYHIPVHEFIKAIIYGDSKHYDPDHSVIANLFDVKTHDRKELFLLPISLGFLSSMSNSTEHGFISTNDFYEHLQGFGFTPQQIDYALYRGSKYALIETSGRLDPGKDYIPKLIRITTTGAYHINRLANIFAYLDAIIIDTPILDEVFYQVIHNVENIQNRLERVKLFKAYLDAAWSFSNFGTTTFDWKSISSELESDISDIERRVKKTLAREAK